MTAIERFLAKVNKDGPIPEYAPELGPCWIWMRAKDTGGYGRFWTGIRLDGAHRFSYEAFVGPIPCGLVIDHRCRVHACVNPDHLEPVTYSENLLRGFPSHWNSTKTCCPQGHAYNLLNTRWKTRRDGRRERHCRTCNRAACSAYGKANRARLTKVTVARRRVLRAAAR